KIPRENINADDVVIKRIRDNAINQVIGYEITTNITIEVEDIKNLGDIYSLAIENGANSEVNISFTLSNVNHHYKKALLKATQDALNKGNLLSKSLNIR
ncbi:SIMPL domain-containing protein, partial [Paeniclostridium sordellii]|uniref:SIMPL domain-containing protein n=1 Tax=Paraclostridium sordellii TaxID=1505 RepID=UPI00210887A9